MLVVFCFCLYFAARFVFAKIAYLLVGLGRVVCFVSLQRWFSRFFVNVRFPGLYTVTVLLFYDEWIVLVV